LTFLAKIISKYPSTLLDDRDLTLKHLKGLSMHNIAYLSYILHPSGEKN
jgi:hypothetical protein